MTPEDDDLEGYWEDIRGKELIKVVSNRASDLKEQLEIACDKTTFDLTKLVREYHGQALTSDLLAKLMSKAVAIFMEKWYEGLRGQNLSGLIELVLQGQQLPAEELKGFVQALPSSLLKRIVESAIGATGVYGNGLHALMAIELHLRSQNIRQYQLTQMGMRLHIEFVDPKRDAVVKFFLDEPIEHVDAAQKGHTE